MNFGGKGISISGFEENRLFFGDKLPLPRSFCNVNINVFFGVHANNCKFIYFNK
jgi:hypothetical protein